MSTSLRSSSNFSSNKKTKVLIVDDDKEFADLAAKMIEKGSSDIQVKTLNNSKKHLKKSKKIT